MSVDDLTDVIEINFRHFVPEIIIEYIGPGTRGHAVTYVSADRRWLLQISIVFGIKQDGRRPFSLRGTRDTSSTFHESRSRKNTANY